MNLIPNLNSLSVNLAVKQLSQKGSLVYEYNPFKTLRINTSGDPELGGEPKGALLDLDTKELGFDLQHPVDMAIQPSYDGSVNIILNDGINQPRMINSRFSVTGMDTYQIVDREGDNDTNIYDKETFDADTSLYKKVRTIAKIRFIGVSTGGNLPVGNYHFYFKLADADGNETDFIGESGLVTCYIGNVNEPSSIQGGIRDQSSFKAVHFKLSNLDSAYSNVVVYYTRYTSDNLANKTTEAYKIDKNFPIYSNSCEVRINGYENKLATSINDINIQYNVVETANTQEIAQNMLFMGNVRKAEIPYKELADLSLRFWPSLVQESSIGFVNENYQDSTGNYEYYNVNNIYYRLGYWDDEIYRFGVVYIMKDYTLSPVFNIRGREKISLNEQSIQIEPIKNGSTRNYIPIDKYNSSINSTDNCKGVCRINSSTSQIGQNSVTPIAIKINGSNELIAELKEHTIGCFFVRQKRIATTLCQAVSMGVENISHLPAIPISGGSNEETVRYLMEGFMNKERILTHNFDERRITLDSNSVNFGQAALCPEYELNPGFYNQFFTGSNFEIRFSTNQLYKQQCTRSGTHLYSIEGATSNDNQLKQFRIVSLQDGQALAKNKDCLYSALAGTAEEVQRVSYYTYRNPTKKATNVLRGVYGPYLGLEGIEKLPYAMTVMDIKIPNYSEANMGEYFQIRYQDTSPFEPISERMEWKEFNNSVTCYRGDCFIGNFTHRMVRNFADPSAPYNDEFISANTWKDNMDLEDSDTFTKVNRGDVNAVKMGHWVTIKVCSNVNLSLRSVDHSWASEEGITNKPRAFYPLYARNTSGENKVPESTVYNDGYSTTLSTKYNYEMPDVPAVKNVFVTRIMYSNIAINDAFRNGFRIFDLMNYRDYTLTYGALTRIIELKGSLLAVFEHGVCLIPVNERVIAGSGKGGNVFINTSNVLPENPIVLSDMFGSQWPESLIKTPYYVYGIDTVGKKIWRTNGQNFDIISDFRVEKFLIDNISLTEAEKTPIIGIRNVKSHYNAFKSDVMFTFYDDINTIEEKVWNLCYNEIQQQFTTFYSWIPSYSANIDNILFSFDRDTSKVITKLTKRYPKIALDTSEITGLSQQGYLCVGKVIVNDADNINYKIEMYDDNQNNADRYRVVNNYLYISNIALSEISYHTPAVKATPISSQVTEQSNVSYGPTIYGTVGYTTNTGDLTTSFWKHGQAGLMKTEGKILPCNWYGKQHPFEFEFLVLDNPQQHKIFNNLQIISNKAQPESFHFDVVGQVYEWAPDKLNMYCRQEATKQLYQRLGSNIKYNPNYKELEPKQRKILGTVYNQKSTYLPLYYRRTAPLNKIYNYYTMMTSSSIPRDYAHLSGSEIIYDPQLNEFRIWTHIGCCPIDGYYDKEITQAEYNYITSHFVPMHRRAFAWQENDGTTKYYERIFYGRIKGNSEYKEDKWYVQIPSITFMQKNEPNWEKPPIIINPSELPNDLQSTQITATTLPNGYSFDGIQVLPNTGDRGDAYPPTYGGWTARKETKIRDKYMRVRIRYKGDELATITAIKTIYTESYA